MKAIRSAAIDVTYLCNLKCKHCYNSSNRIDPDEMTSQRLVTLGHEIGNIRVDSICLCGGEPLCRLDDLIETCKAIKSEDPGKQVAMVSNGLLWTPEVASRIKAAGMDAVQFSIDGFTNGSYDAVRLSGGRLHKVFDAVDYALDAGFRVMAACLPHKGNFNEIDSIIDFCAEKGIEEVRFQPLMPLGRGEESYSDIVLSTTQYSALQEKIQAGDLRYPNTNAVWGDPIDHFFMLQEVDYLPHLSINAHGEIVLSPYLPITIWNLKKHTLQEYITQRIPEKCLKHPLVTKVLEDIVSVEDLTSHPRNLPDLFAGQNIDLSDEIMNLEVTR